MLEMGEFYLSGPKANRMKIVISQQVMIFLFAFEAIKGYNCIRI